MNAKHILKNAIKSLNYEDRKASAYQAAETEIREWAMVNPLKTMRIAGFKTNYEAKQHILKQLQRIVHNALVKYGITPTDALVNGWLIDKMYFWDLWMRKKVKKSKTIVKVTQVQVYEALD